MSKNLKDLQMFNSWEVNQVVNKPKMGRTEFTSLLQKEANLAIMKKLVKVELSPYVLNDIAEFAADPKDTIINYSFSKFNYLDETETTCMDEYIQVFANQDPVQVELGWFMVLEEFRKEIEIILTSMTDKGIEVQTTEFEERVIDDLKFELPIVIIGFIKKGGK